MAVEPGAEAEDRRLCADGADDDRADVEIEAILLDFDAQDLAKEFAQAFRAHVDRGQEIDVAGGARVRSEPMAQEQGALEDQPLPMRGASQPVQEAFEGVQFEQLGEGAVPFPGRILEAVVNGLDKPAGPRPGHRMASR